MELELERTQRSGYETVLETTVTHEETMEMIVPDACPDILRICDTGGAVCLRSKEVLEGRVEVLGSVKASVLYLPDGEEGMRKLEVPMPFTCGVDAAGVTGQCTVVAIPPRDGGGNPQPQPPQGAGAGQSGGGRPGLRPRVWRHLHRRAQPRGGRGAAARGAV